MTVRLGGGKIQADMNKMDGDVFISGTSASPVDRVMSSAFFLLDVTDPESPPAIEDATVSPAAVELGKMLYFDPRLSASHLLSCNTCHNVGLAGVDLQETSTGHGWQKGPRNAPTVLNAAFNQAQFWDGRAPDLREQAKGPIQAAVEMSNSPERVVETLRMIPEYVDRFEAAFPADATPLSFDNVARAIEAFEATLVTPDAPFDRYLAGDHAALSSGGSSTPRSVTTA